MGVHIKNHEGAILVPTIDREKRSRLSKQHKKECGLVSRQKHVCTLHRDAEVCAGLVPAAGLPEAGVPDTRGRGARGHRRGDPGHPLHQRQGVLHHHEHVLQRPVAGEQVRSNRHVCDV